MKLLLLLFPVLCFAESAASDLSLVAGGAWPGPVPIGGALLDTDPSVLVGARYEKDFMMLLGFENSLILGPGMFGGPGRDGATSIAYTANAVFNLPVDKIVPNFAVGLGLLYHPGSNRLNVGGAFLTDWGFGIKFRELAGPLGCRIDYRRIGIRDVQNEKNTTTELTGGLLFTW